ncbi:hypothetical protein FRB90_010324 [Tulasnella sp. 427]|nr:hypothetical protein FRB90_010324 [Tulasnella sp. 427]
MSTPLATPNDPPTTPRPPPPTVASRLNDVFAFRPPYRPEDHRYQTSSSTSTVPQVVTPPTGLPLSELASFNGHQPTHLQSLHAAPNPVPSTPNFAFQPPTSASTDAEAHPRPSTSGADNSPFTFIPPPTEHREATADGTSAPLERPHSTKEPLQEYLDLPTLSRSASKGSLEKVSNKSEYDIYKVEGDDHEVGREYTARLDTRSPWASTSNGASDPDLYSGDVEDSPFPEVRASVSNTDDVDMPCLTFRGLGPVFFCPPSPVGHIVRLANTGLTSSQDYSRILAVLLLPGGWEFSLNPSPWGIKEHAMVLLLAFPATNPDYGLRTIAVIEKWYKIEVSLGFTISLLLSTQLIGIGLAGLARPIVVEPASFIWPSSLISCVVLNTLHADEVPTNGLSRMRFLCYVAVATFFYYFLPGFLFTGLSYFSFVCWIRPNNRVVNQLFGSFTGLGMSFLNFDWIQISWTGSPLMVPFWSQLNVMAGFVLFYWIITPILYYSNVWKTGHLPISGLTAYDRFAQPYNISRVVTSDRLLNVTAYEEYSPLYLPVTYAMTYFLAFMLSTALIVHSVLSYGPEAIRRLKGQGRESEDIHAKFMKNYDEVPSWCYWAVVIFTTILMIVAVKVEDVGMPLWVPLLAVLVIMIESLPMAYMLAMTGEPASNNLIAQVIAGSLLPGSAPANLIFKTFVVQGSNMMTNLSWNLKIAHYIKCGHRPVFLVQVVGGLVGLFTQIMIKAILFQNIPDICDPNQPDFLTCPGSKIMYTASLVWGLVGPTRQFGRGSIYWIIPYAALLGAILPIPIWLWVKRHPTSKLRYSKDLWARSFIDDTQYSIDTLYIFQVHVPLVITGPTWIPQAGGINYSSWFIVGVIFQYWIKMRKFKWWMRYNYVLSAALDLGTSLGFIVVFLALQLPKSGSISLNWWGNTVWMNTADFAGVPFFSTDPDQGF